MYVGAGHFRRNAYEKDCTSGETSPIWAQQAVQSHSCRCIAGLPDGVFSNHKVQFESILEGLAVEVVGLFYAIWYILWSFWYRRWPFGIFSRFGMLY
jgi:hypothetical protein